MKKVDQGKIKLSFYYDWKVLQNQFKVEKKVKKRNGVRVNTTIQTYRDWKYID